MQKKHAYQPHIVSFGQQGDTLNGETTKLDIPFTLIDKSYTRRQRLMAIIKLLAQNRTAILHIHSPAALKQLAPCLFLTRLYHQQVIYTRHGCAPLAKLSWRITHAVARPFIDRVTFVSKAGLDAFLLNYPWPQDKLKVIENGVFVPETNAEPIAPNNGKFRLGSVGRMVALKGQKHLLQAMLEIRNSGQTLADIHFFGSGEEQANLENFCQQNQLQENVHFHGVVYDREEVYKHIDLLVVCSESEGLSLAIMEAMARGIPVVATDVGGNPQLVLNKETGILVPYNSVDDLKIAILELQKNKALYQQMSENAKAFIFNHYSLNKTLQQYGQCYQA